MFIPKLFHYTVFLNRHSSFLKYFFHEALRYHCYITFDTNTNCKTFCICIFIIVSNYGVYCSNIKYNSLNVFK